jgi:cytidylate kinase
MIVSISGNQGSGKSTIAQLLAEKLGWPRYYMGGLRREAAQKRGLTLAEYNRLGEDDPATDLEVDRYQEDLGKTQDNFVIEGRTSWHFIPQSFKIFIYVDEAVGAKRIFDQLQAKSSEMRNNEDHFVTYEEVLASVRQRRASDDKRYHQYFGIDVYDMSNYDFCLDTTNLTKEEVFAQVLEEVQKNIDNGKK